MKKTLFAALLTCILVSCAPNVTFTPQATMTQIPATETLSPLPTFTPFPTIPPTIDVSHLEPTITPFVGTPPASTLPKFPMDGYVMTFIKDGYLYFQDEENTPVQLAPVDEEAKQHYISDDNQKVAFHGADGNIYSINSDGSQKQVIVSKEWKNSLKAGTSISIDGFVPDSHQLIFTTNLCELLQESWPPCSTSLFLTDTDTGNIKKLADLGIASELNRSTRNIRISPNGKMIAIGNVERIDILDMEGKVIRQNILTYKPSTPTRSRFPSLFWLPDSSGLTIALPDSKDKDGFLAYSIWRYTIENQAAAQIALEPAPMYDDSTFDVSPDGNWIVYGDLYTVFLGNLVNGQVKAIQEAQQSSFSWGPDSRHFAFGTGLWYISSIDNPSIVIRIGTLAQWVDNTHFLRVYDDNDGVKIRGAEIDEDNARIYILGNDMSTESWVFIKPK